LQSYVAATLHILDSRILLDRTLPEEPLPTASLPYDVAQWC
jgi:hypothetical protein